MENGIRENSSNKLKFFTFIIILNLLYFVVDIFFELYLKGLSVNTYNKLTDIFNKLLVFNISHVPNISDSNPFYDNTFVFNNSVLLKHILNE